MRDIGRLDLPWFAEKTATSDLDSPICCEKLGITLYDDALRNLNFGARRVNLNNSLAQVREGQLFAFRIAHEELCTPNWLDGNSHEQGFVMLRAKGRMDAEIPSRVSILPAEIMYQLPPLAVTVTPGEYANKDAVRLQHYQRHQNC